MRVFLRYCTSQSLRHQLLRWDHIIFLYQVIQQVFSQLFIWTYVQISGWLQAISIFRSFTSFSDCPCAYLTISLSFNTMWLALVHWSANHSKMSLLIFSHLGVSFKLQLTWLLKITLLWDWGSVHPHCENKFSSETAVYHWLGHIPWLWYLVIIVIINFRAGHHGLFHFRGHLSYIVYRFQFLNVLLLYIVKFVG